ncbi:MAG: ribbon-helix-helix protein, CopG family [Candidatus Dormibacteria bacterium]
MRRIQIYIDERTDDALTAESRRRGIAKGALIREAVARSVVAAVSEEEDPWRAMAGWIEGAAGDERVDIDEVVYGRKG